MSLVELPTGWTEDRDQNRWPALVVPPTADHRAEVANPTLQQQLGAQGEHTLKQFLVGLDGRVWNRAEDEVVGHYATSDVRYPLPQQRIHFVSRLRQRVLSTSLDPVPPEIR
jgi:hypothetical protein